MKTILTSEKDFAAVAAGQIAGAIIRLQSRLDRDINIVFATGRTMVGMLDELAKSEGIRWQRVQAFHLDEFCGLTSDHPASFAQFLSQRLFQKVPIPKDHLHWVADHSLSSYVRLLKDKGGADLMILGLGLDGHLAFNKAGTSFDSQMRKVRLTPDVVQAQSKNYPALRKNPFAVTLGLSDIAKAREIFLLVNGAEKSEIVAKTYFAKVSPEVPATMLRCHGAVQVILDDGAARGLHLQEGGRPISELVPSAAMLRSHLALYSQTYSGIRHGAMGLNSKVSTLDGIVAQLYGYAYGQLLLSKIKRNDKKSCVVLLGRDSRPTGLALAKHQSQGLTRAFLEKNRSLNIIDLGVVTTPLLESAIRLLDAQGGVMITASHNPISQNGWKYMTGNRERGKALLDGGSLLGAKEKRQVIDAVRRLVDGWAQGSTKAKTNGGPEIFAGPLFAERHREESLGKESLGVGGLGVGEKTPQGPQGISQDEQQIVDKAVDFYAREVMAGVGKIDRNLLAIHDYNGGAAARVNGLVLEKLGFRSIVALGTVLGESPHGIEPVGAALEPASQAMIRHGAKLGVVYDFDADRGNLVWKTPEGLAADVSPQNVALLNVAVQLVKNQKFDRRRYPKGLAVVGHCATSGSVARVCGRLGASYFTVETGEVNVVEKMADLTLRGFLVVVGVEGYSGGTVFPGSKCRDGLRTLLVVSHLLSSQKMLDTWRQIFGAKDLPTKRQELFVSQLLDTLPRFVSIAGKVTDIALSPRDFRQALELRLLTFLEPVQNGNGGGFALKASKRFYPAVIVEYSGETSVLSRPLRKPVGKGLSGPFADGGWKVRFKRESGAEAFIWVRGSKTEVGIYKTLVDSEDPEEALELKRLLDELTQVGMRQHGENSRPHVIVPPFYGAAKKRGGGLGVKLPPGVATLEMPVDSLILVLTGGPGRPPAKSSLLLSTLQRAPLGNRVEFMDPKDFDASVLAARRPAWVLCELSSKEKTSPIAAQVASFNSEVPGPKVFLLSWPGSMSTALHRFCFDESALKVALRAINCHETQVRRTRYDLAADLFCKGAWLEEWGEVEKTAKKKVKKRVQKTNREKTFGAYQFAAERWHQGQRSALPAAENWSQLGAADRVFFVSPHPDDMEIAAGALVFSLCKKGVAVENLVLSLGANGVQPTREEKELLKRQFGSWLGHLGELRRAEAIAAAATLQGKGPGRVTCRFLAEGYDEAALRANVDEYLATVLKQESQGGKAAGRLIFFLPHPDDEHPRHRLAYQVFRDLLTRHSTLLGQAVDIFLYLSPWAGRANCYFLTSESSLKVAPRSASARAPEERAAMLRKRGLGYLIHELLGGFGSTAAALGTGKSQSSFLVAEPYFWSGG